MECLFCKISRGELAAKIVYQDDSIVAFEDIQPQAKHHLILIPHKHIATLNDIEGADKELLGHLFYSAAQLAKKLGIAEDGYRIVMNCNAAGGQTVFHIHAHLIGGRVMHWPPG